MTSPSAFEWFVVHTLPNAEAKAAGHLVRQGFDIYLPRYLKRRRHARRVETVAAPLFPRYMFVAIDMTIQRWRCIHSTIGVSRLVCHGDTPAPVSGAIVDGLRRREDDGGYIKLEPPRFRAGDKVRILDGAFASILGLFEGTRDSDRVAILLELLGRKVRITVDAESVVAA